MTEFDRVNLINWYSQNRRDLPWRKNRDPYRIWISETMLQQTTTEAVKPYFQRFLSRFPTLEALAQSSIEDVIEMWAGLGYYSRARNLHKAAQVLAQNGFKKSYKDLIELPGFGPYTSRAVSSIAFGEKVGVLDGNVIRVLTRKLNLPVEWWRSKERNLLQSLVDQFVAPGDSHDLNQALMELGATVCLPKNPKCLICPWLESCSGRKARRAESLPLKKPKAAFEILIWRPSILLKNKKLLLVKNKYAPFLKNEWILPGEIKRQTSPPKKFNFKHSITRFDIYVAKGNAARIKTTGVESKWVPLKELKRISPFSLMTKTLESFEIKSCAKKID